MVRYKDALVLDLFVCYWSRDTSEPIFRSRLNKVLMVQGWDQTGSNGANLSFPEEFGIAGPGRDKWLVGLVNSIIFLTAGLM